MEGPINEQQMTVRSGGISGFFGGTEQAKKYTAGHTRDEEYAKNSSVLEQRAQQADHRFFRGMDGAQVGPAAQIATAPQNQMRDRQSAMLNQLSAAAAGNGPSAAQAQLKTGADRAMASNLAMAAAGGNPAARRQAAFNNAASQQDLAGQSASLRAQEQQAAIGQLGQFVEGARGQDIGLATSQAGLNQQAQLAQAGLTQDTQKTNLLAQQEFQKQKDDLVRQYTAAGIQLDDQQIEREIRQRQFNAGLLAQQEAAGMGVSAQNAAQSGQAVGAIAQTAGTVLAAVSDERTKTNVEDGDKSVEKFLDSIAAKDWDYKDPKAHGEGRRTGIMAQDAEKHSDMVFTHKDGVKMLDVSKATSTSLAALANINKRLRQLESKRA